MTVDVIHLQRRARPHFQSIERVFRDVRDFLPEDVRVRVIRSWFDSNGLFKRCLNLLQVAFLRNAVVHMTGDVHYLCLAVWGRKVVLTIHDLGNLHEKRGWSRRVFAWLWFRIPLRVASVVTVISEEVKRDLLAHFPVPERKIKVIHNPVSPDFVPAPKNWPDSPVVLMVGTKPNKNLLRMFEALRGLRAEVRILGLLPPALRARLESTGVPFTELGRLDDAGVAQAYRDCDLLGFASTFEGFGLPIVEAQATGRPVLTADRAPMSEVAGEGAVFVDPESVESIRRGFSRLLADKDLRAALIEKGFANVRRFAPDAVAAEFAGVYRRLA